MNCRLIAQHEDAGYAVNEEKILTASMLNS
jgi:hypothetical protein